VRFAKSRGSRSDQLALRFRLTVLHRSFELIEFLKKLDASFVIGMADMCQAQAASRAIEQASAKALFKLANVFADEPTETMQENVLIPSMASIN